MQTQVGPAVVSTADGYIASGGKLDKCALPLLTPTAMARGVATCSTPMHFNHLVTASMRRIDSLQAAGCQALEITYLMTDLASCQKRKPGTSMSSGLASPPWQAACPHNPATQPLDIQLSCSYIYMMMNLIIFTYIDDCYDHHLSQ